MRWYLKMFTHALRSMRVLPAWSVDVHEVPGWFVEFPSVEERCFWTEAGAIGWAKDRANPGDFRPETVVCFVSRANWFGRHPDGEPMPCLEFSCLHKVCPEGLELDWECEGGIGVRSARAVS